MTRNAEVSRSPEYVLADDVTFIPVEDLSETQRRELATEPGDMVIDRPTARRQSLWVDADTAALLHQFEKPSSVPEGIASLCAQDPSFDDPHQLLDQAISAIVKCLEAGILLRWHDEAPKRDANNRATPRYERGDCVRDCTVERVVRITEDTQVFQARHAKGMKVAIKVAAGDVAARDETSAFARQSLQREADALGRLAHLSETPTLLDSWSAPEEMGLITSWIDGQRVEAVTETLRQQPRDRRSLLTLLASLSAAYARIHEAGVVHGDVRASNILVDERERIHVIDFGLSATTDRSDRVLPRSYDFPTLEPEAAAGFLGGETPAYTAAAEQYALGALTFRLATGHPMRLLPADQESALQRIAEGEPPRPFTQVDTDSWRSLEAAIARATAPLPERRFSTVADLAKAIESAQCPPLLSRSDRHAGTRLVEQTLAALTDTDAAEKTIPATARGLHDGTAGAAWFLYRAALLRDDGTLLCHADRWARTAEKETSPPRNSSIARACSPLHDGDGAAIVRALIALARDDGRTVRHIVQQLSKRPSPGTAKAELFLGQAGRVAALAMLQRALDTYDRHELAAEIGALRSSIGLPMPASGTPLAPIEQNHDGNIHLGMAHGWAGICYAHLQSAATAGAPLDAPLEHCLRLLATLGVASSKDELQTSARQGDMRWNAWPGTVTARDLAPARFGQTTPAFVPGWCSGSAGFVYLWAAAEQVTSHPRYRELAKRAGNHAWRHPDRHGNLCCGLAGRAFALSRLFRLSGDQQWLDRANALAGEAARATTNMDGTGLFRGPWGPALINLELEQPTQSRFPLLEW